jgi:hypothetical protein
LEALRAAVGSTDGERVWKTYLETLLTPDDRARGRRADLGE